MRQRSDEVWPVKRKGGQEKQQSDVLCICLLRNSLGVSGGDWHLNQEMGFLAIDVLAYDDRMFSEFKSGKNLSMFLLKSSPINIYHDEGTRFLLKSSPVNVYHDDGARSALVVNVSGAIDTSFRRRYISGFDAKNDSDRGCDWCEICDGNREPGNGSRCQSFDRSMGSTIPFGLRLLKADVGVGVQPFPSTFEAGIHTS
ncbi:hypothetical protein R6Q59_023067 [Mikania micrantha]